ncbi:MAG TPA: phosphatidate cytidylyltransferase [Spirochaetota bacterium]|nr:phosphatidate cytidylyltransferase [Spirochaetota bacterium]HPI90733.1 phosphatidate cytidylyltransferase [Spirochaetota bacterium]HPR46363.1 phosphatidate cytidylyltransferase [Spirochaetota bacterium]
MNEITRNTLKRIMSAVVALPVYAFAIVTDLFQGIPILIVSLIISLVTLYEYYQIAYRDEENRAFIWIGMAGGFFLNIVMYLFAFGKLYGYSRMIGIFDARVIMGLVVFFMTAVMIFQIFKRPLKGATYSMAVSVFGVIFIVLSTCHIILMKALNNGMYYILILNIAVMINDTGAYFGGVSFGKHKVKFKASPNKSWEGYFSGTLFCILAMIVTNQVFCSFFQVTLFSMIEAAILGILISVLANLGDLIESVFKRDGDIKDSGSIIPGHGGMWDVFDALIFTYPLFYYYLVLTGVR